MIWNTLHYFLPIFSLVNLVNSHRFHLKGSRWYLLVWTSQIDLTYRKNNFIMQVTLVPHNQSIPLYFVVLNVEEIKKSTAIDLNEECWGDDNVETNLSALFYVFKSPHNRPLSIKMKHPIWRAAGNWILRICQYAFWDQNYSNFLEAAPTRSNQQYIILSNLWLMMDMTGYSPVPIGLNSSSHMVWALQANCETRQDGTVSPKGYSYVTTAIVKRPSRTADKTQQQMQIWPPLFHVQIKLFNRWKVIT